MTDAMKRPVWVSPKRWKETQDWVHKVMATADNGHGFRIPSDDPSVMICRHCDLHYPNDASFGYGLCPKYWTADGELRPREEPDVHR